MSSQLWKVSHTAPGQSSTFLSMECPVSPMVDSNRRSCQRNAGLSPLRWSKWSVETLDNPRHFSTELMCQCRVQHVLQLWDEVHINWATATMPCGCGMLWWSLTAASFPSGLVDCISLDLGRGPSMEPHFGGLYITQGFGRFIKSGKMVPKFSTFSCWFNLIHFAVFPGIWRSGSMVLQRLGIRVNLSCGQENIKLEGPLNFLESES